MEKWIQKNSRHIEQRNCMKLEEIFYYGKKHGREFKVKAVTLATESGYNQTQIEVGFGISL